MPRRPSTVRSGGRTYRTNTLARVGRNIYDVQSRRVVQSFRNTAAAQRGARMLGVSGVGSGSGGNGG